jgi:hypothetical protein
VILFYGCWTNAAGYSDSGHFFFSPAGDERYSMRRHVHGRIEDDPKNYVPWGYKVDGGLAPLGPQTEGIVAFSQCGNRIGRPEEEWWSAVSWWDRSVDSRPGSSCTFMVDRRAKPAEILVEAKAAFPQIFARFKYQLVLHDLPASYYNGPGPMPDVS